MSNCLHREKRETEIAELSSQQQLLLLYPEIISTRRLAKGTQMSPNHQDTVFHADCSKKQTVISSRIHLSPAEQKLFPSGFSQLTSALPCLPEAPRGGKCFHPKMLLDHTTKGVLELLLKDPFSDKEKDLLLLTRTVKPAWHRFKEKQL